MAVLDGHQHRDEKRHNLVEPLCVGGGGVVEEHIVERGEQSAGTHTTHTHTGTARRHTCEMACTCSCGTRPGAGYRVMSR